MNKFFVILFFLYSCNFLSANELEACKQEQIDSVISQTLGKYFKDNNFDYQSSDVDTILAPSINSDQFFYNLEIGKKPAGWIVFSNQCREAFVKYIFENKHLNFVVE